MAGAGAKEPRVALGAQRGFGGFREREGDVPGKLVGQGKRWTRHPPAPGSPRTARDCASKLERDAGTVTARYARHISSLLAKPCVIVRPSYVQLKEAQDARQSAFRDVVHSCGSGCRPLPRWKRAGRSSCCFERVQATRAVTQPFQSDI